MAGTELPRAAARVAVALAERGEDAAIRLLPDRTDTAAAAAAALGIEQRQIVKSMVFRTRTSDTGVLVLVDGLSRVDPELLEREAGEPVQRPDADWVRSRTGFAIGGIPPLGHAEPLRTFVDRGLVDQPEVWAAAGTPHAVFGVSGRRLVELTGGRVADVASR